MNYLAHIYVRYILLIINILHFLSNKLRIHGERVINYYIERK